MTIKREAAFHEAGHAIAAHHSKFHNVAGPINLATYGSGEIYVSLSKKKLLANGKVADLSAEKDKEVTTDFAVVLSAGFVAERLAEEREPGIKSNPTCADSDHEEIRRHLKNAGLSKYFNRHEDAARQLLGSKWGLVSSLTEHLLKKVSIGPEDVNAFIENHS